ncbi:MAG: aspartate-semialdehyde dehydrogenase [Solirubrobacteraceae bacterium]
MTLRLAVVGATGAVGSVMLDILQERAFPAREIVPFASGRSAGRQLDSGLTVRALSAESIQDFDVALFSAGSSVSAEWAPRLVAADAIVIDNSSQWRMSTAVPLVVPEVNPNAIESHSGIIANPNCSTMQMVLALKPLHDAAVIERLVISTYQSTSGTGVRAMAELDAQTHALLHGVEPPPAEIYPHRIAYNVIPQVESFKDGDDHTTEERKMMFETRKIMDEPELRISATCARVPVKIGHSQSINIELRSPLEPAQARELLAAAPGVRVVDEPALGIYPLPTEAAGGDEVLVGRIRRDPSHPSALNLWIVGDNLRKGAALNAVQIAELLLLRGLVSA